MMQAKLPSRQDSRRGSGTGLASSAGSGESGGLNTGNSSLKSVSGTPFEAMHRDRDTSGGTLEAWLIIEYCDRGSLQASEILTFGHIQSWQDFTGSGQTKLNLAGPPSQTTNTPHLLHTRFVR